MLQELNTSKIQGKLKMKLGLILTMHLLTACSVVAVDPAFKDVQRIPPVPSEETVRVIVANDRPLAEWIAETRRKCEKFGCAQ